MPFPAYKNKLDVHVHCLPDFYACRHERGGAYPLRWNTAYTSPTWSPESHIEFNTSVGVRKSILSISSPGVYLGGGDTDKAAALARRCNEYTAELKRSHPDIFGFFASVPRPDVARAIEEAEYALPHLHADGIILMSSYDAIYLGDPKFAPFFSAMHRLKATVFVHPTPPHPTSPHPPPPPPPPPTSIPSPPLPEPAQRVLLRLHAHGVQPPHERHAQPNANAKT